MMMDVGPGCEDGEELGLDFGEGCHGHGERCLVISDHLNGWWCVSVERRKVKVILFEVMYDGFG